MTHQIRWIRQFSDLPQSDWNSLALPLKTPFLEWEWLDNLERSGSVTADTGWLPNHLTLWKNGSLIAAAPLYIKGHSYGEFVFDHQWADLASRLGIRYYPKMLGMSPITPCEGYRFLIAPGEDELEITQIMVQEIDRFCKEYGISSCHFLFVDPIWKTTIEQLGFLPWLHHSYIWGNQNYDNFDDYLAVFNANQRRNIKREKKAIGAANLEMKIILGDQVSPAILSLMYDFYADTCNKFGWWGSKYLTPAFFENLYDNYQSRLLFVGAYEKSAKLPVGMSFCIYKDDRLYGRYWGSYKDIDCLHFNACYYTPIDWAIKQQIKTFDPGAGGKHKKRRGFPATPNYSMHRFYHPRLNQILANYIAEVNELEQQEIDTINENLPIVSPPTNIRTNA